MDKSKVIYRALIRTHHMTARKKIHDIGRAASKYDCSVYLKSGAHPPGVMIGEYEGDDEDAKGLREWVGSIKVGSHHVLSD